MMAWFIEILQPLIIKFMIGQKVEAATRPE